MQFQKIFSFLFFCLKGLGQTSPGWHCNRSYVIVCNKYTMDYTDKRYLEVNIKDINFPSAGRSGHSRQCVHMVIIIMI